MTPFQSEGPSESRMIILSFSSRAMNWTGGDLSPNLIACQNVILRFRKQLKYVLLAGKAASKLREKESRRNGETANAWNV